MLNRRPHTPYPRVLINTVWIGAAFDPQLGQASAPIHNEHQQHDQVAGEYLFQPGAYKIAERGVCRGDRLKPGWENKASKRSVPRHIPPSLRSARSAARANNCEVRQV
jgi:hypothetical protein